MSPMVTVFVTLLIGVPLFVFATIFFVRTMKKSNSPVGAMLFGLHLSIVGGILVLDPRIEHIVLPYGLLFLGVILSFFAFRKLDSV